MVVGFFYGTLHVYIDTVNSVRNNYYVGKVVDAGTSIILRCKLAPRSCVT